MSQQRAPQWGRCSCGYPASRDPHAHTQRLALLRLRAGNVTPITAATKDVR